MSGFELYSLVPWVLGLFTFAYVTFIYTIFYKWIGFFTQMGTVQLVILHFFMSQLFYNYIKTVTTSAGSPPPNWKPDGYTDEELSSIKVRPPKASEKVIETAGLLVDDNESDLAKIKYCKKCENFKPLRTHHCSDCNKCILRMDHHCPWVNNCVGYNNHKHFILFVTYLLLEALHMIIVFSARLVVAVQNIDEQNEKTIAAHEGFLLIIQMFIIIPTFLGVAMLLGYQLSLIAGNTTVIETFQKSKEKRAAKRKGKVYHYPFDKGLCGNLKDVLGSRILLWFVPTQPEGDGMHFSVYRKIDV